ncbi:MAG: amylo-alpha-1,6-glucosidase, partial [Acidobacteriota bacterium]
GLMDNSKAGLGALEFGSLTGIQTDIYQAAVWLRAAYSMERLARAMGEENLAARAGADFKKASAAFEAKFWDAQGGRYSYGFSAEGKQVKELTPWCAVPLIWNLGSKERAAQTLEKMSAAELTTDWGVRILSNKSPLYEPLNYNYGAVWPFLTGYVAMALYANSCALQGYQLLRANAEHVFDNSLGNATELFSGSQHIWPQEAVPHQGFSMGGFVLPFVRELLGLEVNAVEKEITFKPSFPADWPEVTVENLKLGGEAFTLRFKRENGRLRLEVSGKPGLTSQMNFGPGLGLGTRVRSAKVNGRPINPSIETSGQVTRPVVHFGLSGQDAVEIEFDPTVEVLPPVVESRVGDRDKGLKIIRLEREEKNLKLRVEGLAGGHYRLSLIHPELVAGVSGAELRDGCLEIQIPTGPPGQFLPHEIVVQTR